MICTNERCFLDTNILVYAHDQSSPLKQAISRHLVRELWKTGTGCISTQVLQELHVTLTRKLPNPLVPDQSRKILTALLEWHTETVLPQTILQATELAELHQLSFWDGLIIATALNARARFLVTEDLHHGFRIQEMMVVNPFVQR
jgi:predicted nucleic acid-binding protein